MKKRSIIIACVYLAACKSIFCSQPALTQQEKNSALYNELKNNPHDEEKIKLLKSQGAIVDRLYFSKASIAQDYSLLKRLLLHDENPEKITYEQFPLYTIDMGSLKVLATDKRFNLNVTENITEQALIHWTTNMCLEDIVLFLRYMGAHTDSPDADGNKPMRLAQAALLSEQRHNEPEIMDSCEKTVRLLTLPVQDLKNELTQAQREEYELIRSLRERNTKGKIL